VEPYYAPSHHLDRFGLNSLGEPWTKRMLGTIGNPNNNALLFLLFLVYWLPKKRMVTKYDLLFSSLSIVAVFACQSRSGFVILLLIIVGYLFTYRPSNRIKIVLTATVCISFVMFQLFGNIYIASFVNPELLEQARIGRFTQWMRIIESMPGKWLLGHGVNKEYFELNGIIAESEYFLMLFRYGISGLLSLLLFWYFLAKDYLRLSANDARNLLFGCITIFVVAGLVNSPLHVIKLSVLFSFFVGSSLKELSYAS
jgi:hypothetical protein